MKRSTGDRPEAIALAGRRAGKSLREIAVDLYGREQVYANWHADSPLRSKLRRLLSRAEARSGEGPDGAGPGTACPRGGDRRRYRPMACLRDVAMRSEVPCVARQRRYLERGNAVAAPLACR